MFSNNVLIGIPVLLYAVYYFVVKRFNYWKDRNVPHLKPLPFFGNYKDLMLLREYFMIVTHKMCKKFPNESFFGVHYGTEPTLIVKDPNILKLIMTKDFYFFSGRENTQFDSRETVTNNMFFHGGDRWKVVRQNLTPLFTSAKIKNMFHLISEIGDSLEVFVKEEVESSQNIEIKSLLVKYTLECILSCGFGISANVLKKDNKNNMFISMGNSLFDTSTERRVKIFFRAIWPKIFYGLGFNLFHPKVGLMFNKLLTDVLESRITTKSKRNDFIDLILSWKNENFIYGDSLDPKCDKKISVEVDNELLVPQCVLFFGAGFETTSTTLSFLMYELAKNRDVQDRLSEEVDSYHSRHNGVLEFECVNEMPYLDACIDETLRLYPVLGVITREVMEDYTLPTGQKLEKGNRIHIPVYHIHRDPKYHPNPDEFKPERFLGDARKNIEPYSFMPFGDGPRICIGQRFAKMVMHYFTLKIFKKYTIEATEMTPKKLELSDSTVVTQPLEDIYVKLVERI